MWIIGVVGCYYGLLLVSSKTNFFWYGIFVPPLAENIRAGNENVYEYASSNVGYRIYLLTFLLVASFAVLFLHWYTP